MPMNGFSAGVEPGGLYQMADIQLLLCYVLCKIKEPMPRAILMDVVVGNGMANFFETTEALEALLTVGSVTQGEDTEQLLTLSEIGRSAVEMLHGSLPRTLRERSVEIAARAMTRRRNERDSEITVTDLPHGCNITFTIRDVDAPLMSLTLKVADRAQADLLREHFLDSSDLLYRSVISLLTGRADTSEEDGQTVIRLP